MADLNAQLEKLRELQASAAQELDPLKKQEKLLQCRLLQKALKMLVGNVRNVASKLDVVVEFLDAISTQLTSIEDKLDGIQTEVVHA